MTGRRAFLCAYALIGVAALLPAATLAEDARLTSFGGAKQFVQYGKVDLTKDQAKGLAIFRKKVSYFGAFAINATNGAWGTSAGYLSQSNAEKSAVVVCQGFAQGKPCKIVAAILPKAVPAGSRGVTGLSAGMERFYKNDYLRAVKKQKSGTYAAFALGGRAGGYETNAKSAKEAKLQALKSCDEAEAGNQRRVKGKVRSALKKLGAYTCAVVDVRGPSG